MEHCIRAHRFRDASEQPESLEAKIVYDADKLDAIGAIGVARAVAYAVQAGMPVYAVPSKQFLETGKREADEPHSAYHEFQFKLKKIHGQLFTKKARQLGEERHRLMADYFGQLSAEITGRR